MRTSKLVCNFQHLYAACAIRHGDCRQNFLNAGNCFTLQCLTLQPCRNKRNTHEEYSHHHICEDGWDYHCHNKAQQTRTYKQESGKFECLSRMPWRGEGSTHFLLDESL